MKAIIGLGNPGKKYEQTRHNVGFLVLDELARQHDATFTGKRSLEAEIAEVTINDERVLLVKPQTFMNVSGRSVASVLSKNPLGAEDILVVYDEADYAFGDIRFKAGGSSAGHNGMQSIINVFPKGTSIGRVRVGIGRPSHPDIPLDVFVLQTWTESESTQLPEVIDNTLNLITTDWL